MKTKSWIKYIIYIVLIIGLIYLDGYVEKQSSIYAKEQFQFNTLLVILPIFIKIGIGIILGLDCFVNQLKKEGVWKFNIPKLILMAIPSLYFALAIFIYYANVPFLSLPLEVLSENINMSFTSMFQLIFGYSIITSVYKFDRKINS